MVQEIDFADGELGSYNPYDPSENAEANIEHDVVRRQRVPFTRYFGGYGASKNGLMPIPVCGMKPME